LSLGDLTAAEEHYRRAISLGFDRYAYLGMAKVLAGKNEVDEAIRMLAFAAQMEPGEPRIAAELKKMREIAMLRKV
ncbi:MAG: tetratricopeptide repeat protein, partial [Desulfobacterales bacterium]|nr:tetratricopeptide repeat protein [Desulfobacterales bacterium]